MWINQCIILNNSQEVLFIKMGDNSVLYGLIKINLKNLWAFNINSYYFNKINKHLMLMFIMSIKLMSIEC